MLRPKTVTQVPKTHEMRRSPKRSLTIARQSAEHFLWFEYSVELDSSSGKHRKMRDGDQHSRQSFSELIRPQLERMYRLAYRLTRNQHDAQDLVQDVLLKLYPQRKKLIEVDLITPWIGTVVYRQFVDNRRRYAAKRLHIVSDDALSVDPDLAAAEQASTEELADAEFNINRLESAVAQLSEDHRLIINLHDVEGYTISEIAEITGIPMGTVKSRRQRARERLQELLDEGPV